MPKFHPALRLSSFYRVMKNALTSATASDRHEMPRTRRHATTDRLRLWRGLPMRHFIAFVAALTVISCAGTQERALVHVPASPATIAIERVATHAFLAEYDRTVTIEIDGRPA